MNGSGRTTNEKLEKKDTKSPPIDGAGVAKALDDLGGDVLLGADKGVGDDAGLGVEHALLEDLRGELDGGALAEVKVGEDDVAGGRHEDVLGLEVAVDEAEHVEVLEREQDLAAVELGPRLGEAVAGLALERAEELAARAKVHHKVEAVHALERPVQRHDERVVRRRQDLALRLHALHLLALDHLLLRQHLHRVALVRPHQLHEVHAAHVAAPQQLQPLEALRRDLHLRRCRRPGVHRARRRRRRDLRARRTCCCRCCTHFFLLQMPPKNKQTKKQKQSVVQMKTPKQRKGEKRNNLEKTHILAHRKFLCLGFFFIFSSSSLSSTSTQHQES